MTKSLLTNSRTKTVATVGPASATQEKLAELIQAGVDVFRLNMAHGKRDAHELALSNIRAASEQLKTPVGIYLKSH